MNWNIEYSKRANDFIEEHGIRERVRESIKNFILKITGLNINIDVKIVKGRVGRLLSYPQGKNQNYP